MFHLYVFPFDFPFIYISKFQEPFHNQYKIFWYGVLLKTLDIFCFYLFRGTAKWWLNQLITFNHFSCRSSPTALGTRIGSWKLTWRGTDETTQVWFIKKRYQASHNVQCHYWLFSSYFARCDQGSSKLRNCRLSTKCLWGKFDTLQIFTPWKVRGLRISGSLQGKSALWKRAVRIARKPHDNYRTYNYHGAFLQFLQPFSIDSADFPCRDPAIPSPCSFNGVNICSVLWPLVKSDQNWKVDWSTAYDFTVIIIDWSTVPPFHSSLIMMLHNIVN